MTIIPKITYNNGAPQTLNFLYPPTSKPKFNKAATRTDTFSTAGNRQTVLQRVNETFPLQMTNILVGADAEAWQKFLDFAVTGGQFNYYPDHTNGVVFYVMFLSDTSAQLAFSSAGIYTLTANFQREIV